MIRKMTKLAISAAFAVYALWGFSFLASACCQEYASPFLLLMYRFDIAALVLLVPILAGFKRISLRGKKPGLILLTGLFEPVIYFIGEQYGLKYTNSSFSGITVAVIPVITMLLAFIFLRERPTVLQWLFCLLSIGGVVLVTVAAKGSEGAISFKGVLFLLVAVLSGSACGITSSLCSNEFTVYERTFIMQLMGAVFYTLMAFIECGFDFASVIAPATEPDFMVPLLYLALGASVTGYFLFNFAVSYAPVTNVISFCNLTTVISVAAGVLILHEPFSIPAFFGAAAVLIGIWGVQKSGRKE